MVHVVIAGAGIVGVSSAIWLQRAGHELTLVRSYGWGVAHQLWQCGRSGRGCDPAGACAWIGAKAAKNGVQP